MSYETYRGYEFDGPEPLLITICSGIWKVLKWPLLVIAVLMGPPGWVAIAMVDALKTGDNGIGGFQDIRYPGYPGYNGYGYNAPVIDPKHWGGEWTTQDSLATTAALLRRPVASQRGSRPDAPPPIPATRVRDLPTPP